MYHENLKNEKKKGKPVQFNPDLKESFIENYILWLKYESQGIQKVDKEVRKIFWLNIPFPKEIKEILKNRGFHYKELYEKDKIREKSKGY
jgi:5'-deoxynucleotidase YfbR-like HD superfamily hydrolase